MALEDELDWALWELGDVCQCLAFVTSLLEDEHDANQGEPAEGEEEAMSIDSPPHKRIYLNAPGIEEEGSIDSSPLGFHTRGSPSSRVFSTSS